MARNGAALRKRSSDGRMTAKQVECRVILLSKFSESATLILVHTNYPSKVNIELLSW